MDTSTLSELPCGPLTPFPGLFDRTDDLDASGPPAPSEGAIRFVVYGEAKSAGSKRAFPNPKTGRMIVTETVKGSKDWQASVRAVAREAYTGPLLTGPLAVTMHFYRPRPASHYGSGRNSAIVKPSAPSAPATRPDVLKLARGVEDSLSGVLYRDDAQIVSETIEKRYGEPARVELVVEPL
jgi:Holliday junction resolvase RusA-like endonuclease